MTDPSYEAARAATLSALARLCVEKGLRYAVIAPGSRSAPLTAALAAEPGLRCFVVPDERSAGYVALGLAQQSRQPTLLVCTSGTAALNFAPAATEAYYQGVPLLLLTADRPPEWVDQQDNQAIHQTSLYQPHLRAAYQWPTDWNHPDARWYAYRTLDEAIELSRGLLPGPVHINAPLREPLYPASLGDEPAGYSATAFPVRRWLPGRPQLDAAGWDEVLERWQAAPRKLVLAGMASPDPDLRAGLAALAARPDVAVLADITANLAPAGGWVHSDLALAAAQSPALQALAADLVIAVGGPLTSKFVRQWLRRYPPAQQWRIQPAGVAPDTFQTLTHVIPMLPGDFFGQLAARAPSPTSEAGAGYAEAWHVHDAAATAQVERWLAGAGFGEMQALHVVLQALPPDSRLQIGNSMAIRYANWLGMPAAARLRSVHSNRGTSGIDGTVSTAVGSALAAAELTTLVVGDLGFFYDRNGLWHDQVPANLRIVVLNNHGGGIFDLIDGPDRLPAALRERYFLTPQPLTARRTAEDHGLDYVHVGSLAGLQAALPGFFALRGRPALLEIESDMAANRIIFQQFKNLSN